MGRSLADSMWKMATARRRFRQASHFPLVAFKMLLRSGGKRFVRLPLIFPGGCEKVAAEVYKDGQMSKRLEENKGSRETPDASDLPALHTEKPKVYTALCSFFKTYSGLCNSVAEHTVCTYSRPCLVKSLTASLLSVWSGYKLAHTWGLAQAVQPAPAACCSHLGSVSHKPNSTVISPTPLRPSRPFSQAATPITPPAPAHLGGFFHAFSRSRAVRLVADSRGQYKDDSLG